MKFFLPLLLASLITSSNWYVFGSICGVTVENGAVTGVEDKNAMEVRIYKEDNATSIADGAFDDCSFTTIMISYTITEINEEFPNTLKTIDFTGSKEQCLFAIPNDVVINYYACDEGFLNFWSEYIRPGINGSICNVTKSDYLTMKQLYSQLSETDQNTVLATDDGSGKIANSIKFLDDEFSSSNKSRTTDKEISQSVMITLILIIASFGMTSIGIFYILKDKKVIK